jgi:RNase P subunit RPR2
MEKTKKIKNFLKTTSLKEIVAKKIDQMIEAATKQALYYPDYAIKNIKLVRKIAARHRIAMGSKRKQLFCKKCNFPYIKNLSLRIEKDGNFVIFKCLVCSNKYRLHKSKVEDKR